MEKFKKKKEEQEKVRLEEALDEFCQTFEEGGLVKVPKTFIRGDVVNANKTVKSSTGNGSELAIYKPTPVIQISAPKPAQGFETARKIAEETAKKIMKEAVGEKAKPAEPSPISRPPKPGTKKVVEKSRLTNLEAFKEELKHMQAMRDERKGLRQQLKEKLGVADEELNRIAPSLDAPYTGPGVPANVDFENDPSTTNLYACNLPSDAKLEDFFETFGTFGPLASAKILYPKPDEERHWNTLSGFVAFMNRKDAERALCAMHGDVIRGCELRVSWARQVLMPPVPFYVPPTLRELSMPDPPSGLPFNAKPTSEDLRLFLQRYHDLPKLGASMEDSNAAMVADYKKMIENATVRVVIPTERPLLQLIHRVVEFLVRSGPLFEAILMARERKNTMYRFLFDNHHPTHVYYRWRLYTVLQGDDPQRWRLDKFKMFEGGSWWQPPPHALFELGMPPQLYDTAYIPKRRRDRGAYEKRHMPMKRESDDEGEDRESRRKRALKDDLEREERQKRLRGILSDKDREELEGLLRNLTPEKTAIGDAMVWCLDHAECSKEIAQCIAESLCIKETPLHKKIARIYMVSDILANCAVRIKDAFYYRQHFGAYLQKIFIQLNESLESIESRLKAEQFRQRVMLCFRNWEDHAIYPTHDLIQWQNIFLGLLKAQTNVDSSIDGEPMVSEEFDEEIGVPIPEDGVDIDGVLRAMEGFVEEEEEIDGIPMDENLSIAESDVKQEQDTRFTTGSWSTIEPEETIINTKTSIKSKWESKWDHHQGSVAAPFSIEQQQQEEEEGPIRKKHKLTRLSSSPSKETKIITTTGTQAATNLKASKGEIGEAVDEELRRKLLREIELKVMKLQDELESDTANISAAQIESEIANYRAKLMARMEEKLHESVADESRRESRGARRQKSPDKKVEGRRNSTTSKRTEDERERGREHNGRRERNETKSREYSRTRNRSRNRERSRSRERDRDRERSRERDSDRDRREHDRDRDNRRRGRSRSNSPESRRRL